MSNQGKRWSPEDHEQVKTLISQGKSDQEIATKLVRTVGSIYARKIKIASEMVEQGTPRIEALELMIITNYDLERYNASKNKPVIVSTDTKPKVQKRSKDIYALLNLILDQQEKILETLNALTVEEDPN